MMSKQQICLLTLLISFTCNLIAQDPEFSQFYANSLYTNPAFAGTECGRVSMAYRMQYYGMPGGLTNANIAFDQRVNKIGGGVGFMFSHDNAMEGLLKSTHINAVYAYEYQINKKVSMRVGLQAGIFQKKIDWDLIRWQNNPFGNNIPRINRTVTRANFALGALIYSNKFYVGLACHNLTEPTQPFFNINSSLPRRITLHGGYVFALDGKPEPKSTISPNICIASQGKFTQVNLGFYANKGPFVAGIWYRQSVPNADEVIVLLGYRNGNWKLSYSADATVTKLETAGQTAHELVLTYQFNTKCKAPCFPNVRCPSF